MLRSRGQNVFQLKPYGANGLVDSKTCMQRPCPNVYTPRWRFNFQEPTLLNILHFYFNPAQPSVNFESICIVLAFGFVEMKSERIMMTWTELSWLSRGSVYYAVQDGSVSLLILHSNPRCVHLTVSQKLFIIPYNSILFSLVGEI